MPLQVIETSDPYAEKLRLGSSAIYEMIVSLQVILDQKRHFKRAKHLRDHLSDDFMQELEAIYSIFSWSVVFVELAIDYPDHDDVLGFLKYVRVMDQSTFLFYLLGRIIPHDQLVATDDDPAAIQALMNSHPYFDNRCFYKDQGAWLHSVDDLKNRLVDMWAEYWDLAFRDEISKLEPHWNTALHDKETILRRDGTQGVFENLTGHSHFPDPIPPDHPYEKIEFIPVYLLPKQAFIFYGYGRLTVLFDAGQTEERQQAVEVAKDQALLTLKGLGDDNRLKILRLIAMYEGRINGKKIAEKLNLSPSAISRQIAQLKEGNLIRESSEDNRTIVYFINRETISSLPDILLDYLHS